MILVRFLLLALFVLLLVRAVWRLLVGVAEGAWPERSRGGPPQGVRMMRDPVCGTFVVPGKALAVRDGGRVQYFCSEKCRDAYLKGK
jgi:YHS domain-containing protein